MINWWLHHRALRIAPKGSPDVDCLTWLLHSWWWILWFDDCSIWANIVFDSLTTKMNKSVNTLVFSFHSAVRIQKCISKKETCVYIDIIKIWRLYLTKTFHGCRDSKHILQPLTRSVQSSAAFQRFGHANSPECRSHSSTWTFVLMNEKSFIRVFLSPQFSWELKQEIICMASLPEN